MMTEDRRAAYDEEVGAIIRDTIAKARDLALEEAARVAEQTNTALLRDGSFFSERVAAAIRALKGKP